MSKIVFFVGPYHGVVTGQSKCFKVAVDSVEGSYIFSTGGEGLSHLYKISISIWSLVRFIILSLFLIKKDIVVYITPSRTLAGFCKEIGFFTFSLLFKCKLICHWHGSDLYDFLSSQNFLLRKFIIKIYSMANVHIVLTEGMKEQLKLISTKEVVVLPNFHDIDFYPDCNINHSFNITFMSNIIYEKGVLDAVEAFKIFRQEIEGNSKVKLNIVGQVLDSSLLDKINGQERVVIHGPLYGEKKDLLLGETDVFIFPSFYKTEAFPLVVLEAMATHNSIIAYDHNYISDFFNFDGGWLVDKRNVSQLSKKLSVLFYDRELLSKQKESNYKLSKDYTQTSYKEKVNNICSRM